MANGMEGKHHTEEAKQKISKANKGNTYCLGYHHTEEAKRNMSNANRGRICTEETRERIRKMQKGKKRGPLSEEHKKKIGIANRGISRNKGRKLTKEHIRKCLMRRTPSSLEEKFQSIVDKHNLPYKYVGNGLFFIERYNPDFINTNNEKIAIEVYATYYKKRNHKNIEEWELKRQNVFNKYGWKIVFFDEIETNEKNILNILGGV